MKLVMTELGEVINVSNVNSIKIQKGYDYPVGDNKAKDGFVVTATFNTGEAMILSTFQETISDAKEVIRQLYDDATSQ